MAKHKEEEKDNKNLVPSNSGGYNFTAFAAECFGFLAPAALRFMYRLVERLTIVRHYPRWKAHQIVFQRISFAIHLGTARQLLARADLLPPSPPYPFRTPPNPA